jgi:hypothetical protein
LSIEIYKNSYPLFDPLLVSTQKLLKIWIFSTNIYWSS